MWECEDPTSNSAKVFFPEKLCRPLFHSIVLLFSGGKEVAEEVAGKAAIVADSIDRFNAGLIRNVWHFCLGNVYFSSFYWEIFQLR